MRLKSMDSLDTAPTIYYCDPVHRIEPHLLPAEVFKQALEAMILVTTDGLIIEWETKRAYLARRRHRPMRNRLWYIGGRRFAGETTTDAIKRCFVRETSLSLPDRRFVYVDEYEYLFEDREQEPRDAGTHTLSHTFAVFLKAEEIAALSKSLDPEEYYAEEGLRAFDRMALAGEEIHASIADVYDRVIASVLNGFRLS